MPKPNSSNFLVTNPKCNHLFHLWWRQLHSWGFTKIHLQVCKKSHCWIIIIIITAFTRWWKCCGRRPHYPAGEPLTSAGTGKLLPWCLQWRLSFVDPAPALLLLWWWCYVVVCAACVAESVAGGQEATVSSSRVTAAVGHCCKAFV